MSEPQRTGPEWLRFEAWRLDLHKGTMAQETMADKLRKYADAWEEQVTQLEAEVERLTFIEYKIPSTIYENIMEEWDALQALRDAIVKGE